MFGHYYEDHGVLKINALTCDDTGFKLVVPKAPIFFLLFPGVHAVGIFYMTSGYTGTVRPLITNPR